MNDDNRRNVSDKEEKGDEDQIYQKEEPPSTEEVDKVEEEEEKGKHENENESQNQSQSHIQQQQSQTSQMQRQQDPNLTRKGGDENVSEPLQEEQDSGNNSLAQNLSLGGGGGAKKETYASSKEMRKSSSSQQSGESSSVPHIQHQKNQPLLHSQQYASPSKREDNKKRTASQLSPPATGAKGSQVSKQIKLDNRTTTTTATVAADNNQDLIKMQEEEEEIIILDDWNRALDAHIQKLALNVNVKKDQIVGEMTKIMQNTIAGISNQEEVVKAIRLEITKAQTDLNKACKQHQQTMDEKYQTYKSRLENDRQLFRDEQEEKMNNLQQKMDKFNLDRKSMKTYQQEQEESIKARIKEALEMNQEMYNTSEDNFQAMLKEDEDSIKHFLKEEEDQKKETRLRISRTKKIKDLQQQQVGSKKTKRGRGDRKKSVLSLSSSSAFHELTTEIEKHYADLESHIQGRVKQLSHKVLECENLTHDINIDDKRIRNASSDHKTTFEDIKTQVKDLSAQFRRLQEVQSDLHVQQAELEEQITRKQQILKEERTNTQALMTQQIEQCRIDTLHVKLELTELQNGVADLTKRYSSLNEHLNYLANQDLPHLDSVLRDTTAEQKHRLKTIEQNMEATQYALNNDRITQEQIKREIDTYFVRTFPEVWEEKRRILAHLTSDNNHVLMDDFVKLYDQKEENIKAFWSSKVEEAAANNKGGFGVGASGGESQKNKMIMPPPQQQQQQQHKLFTAPFSSNFSPLRDNSHFGWEPSPISDRHSSFTNKKMLPLAAAAEEETTPTTAGFRIGSGGGGIDMNQGGRGTSSETVMGLGRGTSAGSAVGGRGRGGFDAFGSGLESRGSASIVITNQQAFGERGVGVGGGAAGSGTIISSTDKDSKQEKLSKQQQQQPLSSDDPVSSTSNLKTSTTKRNFINHALISKNAAIYTGELPHKQLQESTKKGK